MIAGPAMVLAAWLGWARLRDRAQRKQRNVLGPWPIPTVALADLDPVFAPGPYGPTTATEVAFIGRGPFMVPGGTSDVEAWVLAVLARGASHCFEFGTCTGKTADLWARNALAHEVPLRHVQDTSFVVWRRPTGGAPLA
jgi:hypothetical protein